MIVAANQKIAICNTWKDGVVPPEFQPYSVNSMVILSKAAHLLSPNAMLIYLYLSGNRNGYGVVLSGTEICDWAGMSKSTCFRGIKELISKRFLCLQRGIKNVYDFYLLPDNNFSECQIDTNESQIDTSECQNDTNECQFGSNECENDTNSIRAAVNADCQIDTNDCQIDSSLCQIDSLGTQFQYRNNLHIINNHTSSQENNTVSIVDYDLNSTSSQENSINTSSQAKSISVAKKEEIDVGDCKYSFTDLVNAIRVIYRYDYDGAVERIKGTFEPEQRHEDKWRALGFTSPEGLQRAVERGRIKFADEAEPP